MSHNFYILILFLGLCFSPQLSHAQDFGQKPTDDLGIHEDQFQEYFFEALSCYFLSHGLSAMLLRGPVQGLNDDEEKEAVE